jgi:hypothetical protein
MAGAVGFGVALVMGAVAVGLMLPSDWVAIRDRPELRGVRDRLGRWRVPVGLAALVLGFFVIFATSP